MKNFLMLLSLFVLVLPATCYAGPLQNIQNDIGTDKVAHFGIGYIVNDQLERHTKFTPFERFLTVSMLAYIKEITDDHFDRNDLIATCAGSLVYEVKW